MTEEEAHKINDLYKQIDILTAENTALKSLDRNADHDHSDLICKLESIETKVDKLTSKK